MASGTTCSPRKRTCSALFAPPPVPTEVILEAQNYSSKILTGLELLRESGDLCDYTLIADGNEFKVGIQYLPSANGKGYVFSRVCPSFCRAGGSHVTIAHDALDLTVQGIPAPPPPWISDLCTGPPSAASDIWWPTLETCSNLFT